MRINMRLLTAADIVLPTHGTKIDPDILVGRGTRDSNLNWPKQMSLPEKWNEVFRNVLFNVIQPQLNSTPLGKWKNIGHQGHLKNVIIQHDDDVHNDVPVMEAIAPAPRWQRQLLRGESLVTMILLKYLIIWKKTICGWQVMDPCETNSVHLHFVMPRKTKTGCL